MGFFPSTSVPDSEYLLTRSSVEATMAASARTGKAAAAHHKIASCYLAKLFGGQSAAALDIENLSEKHMGRSELRFADLTSIPENDELIQLLHYLR